MPSSCVISFALVTDADELGKHAVRIGAPSGSNPSWHSKKLLSQPLAFRPLALTLNLQLFRL
jgi:hypothetical protein